MSKVFCNFKIVLNMFCHYHKNNESYFSILLLVCSKKVKLIILCLFVRDAMCIDSWKFEVCTSSERKSIQFSNHLRHIYFDRSFKVTQFITNHTCFVRVHAPLHLSTNYISKSNNYNYNHEF